MTNREGIPDSEVPAVFLARLVPEIEKELERRRPGSPERIEDEQSPVDWWHYAGIAGALHEISEGASADLSAEVTQSLLDDMEKKLATETGDERIWNYVLYASRLRKLDIVVPDMPAAMVNEASGHVAVLRAATNPHAPWYLAYYLSHLTDLRSDVGRLVTDEDWSVFAQEATAIFTEENIVEKDFLLAQFITSLYSLDADRAGLLIRGAGIDLNGVCANLRAKAEEAKTAGDGWMMQQYARAYKQLLEVV